MVAGERPQEEMGASEQRLVEHDRARTGHRPDEHTEIRPFLQVGSTCEPS